MSCEIQLTATLEGINKFLQPSSSSSGENEGESSKNWFLEYKIAISPTSEIIVFAKSSLLVIYGSKWNSSTADEAKIKYTLIWHGHLQCKQGEKITSVLCLPFFSYGQTVHGADWTCIVVGFSSGCIRFYTEGMQELANNILHEEPVVEIKSYCPALMQQGKTLKQDNNNIYVLYKTVICVFNGPNLSQTLITRRNQLAKGITSQNNELDVHTAFDFKKYGFSGQEIITDACFLGQAPSSTYNTFDHLVKASYIDGFNRPSPSQTSLIVTSGKRPFVGFHYTVESGNSPVLADVALAMANKIKSSVTSNLQDWFGFGSKRPDNSDKPKEVSNEYTEKLNCRFGLCDIWRQGQSIILSPDGAFSAVSDSLGRVIFIENATGCAQRMWKGFRDAQCGFLQVNEDDRKMKHKKIEAKIPQRQGLFIVIYAPRKGVIEIFSTQTGRRVTNFNVTKLGRLIYNPRGYIAPNGFLGTHSQSRNQVVFISEEGLKEFLVPFHCALAEDNSKMSRDLHVLRKMKLLLKTEWSSSNFANELEKCAKELKTDEVKYQAIELLNSKYITLEAFKAVLSVFLESPQKADQGKTLAKKTMAYAELMSNLLSFYEFLNEINDFSVESKGLENFSLDGDSLFEVLRISKKELDVLLKFIDQINEIEGFQKSKTKVTFDEKKYTALGKYLSCFDFECFLNSLERQENQPCRLRLKQNAKEEILSHFSELLFKGVLNSISHLSEWSIHTQSCCLYPNDLALCLLTYWCNQPLPKNFPTIEVTNFVNTLKTVCSLNESDVVSVEYNVESPWWQQLRSYISTSPSTVHGLFAALGCRSVTIFAEQERELAHKKGETTLHNEWEAISKDTCQWDILITQLQDVALLNAILKLKFQFNIETYDYPEIPFDFEYQCLNSIQQSGTGRVSELVAKWLAQFGFNPSVFVNKNDLEFQSEIRNEEKNNGAAKFQLVEEFNKANEARGRSENIDLLLNYLALLKNRFPYSLTTSSLLSNLCWEFTAHWYKNVKDMNYLEAAVRCLEIIPANKIKYGISFLSWNTYLQQKFQCLASMINKIGKVPKDKLCVQEIGLGSDQVPLFLKLIGDYLKMMLPVEMNENQDLGINRETIWQNGSTAPSSSLVSIALAQPMINSHIVMLLLQLTTSLLLMSGLNIKMQKVFINLFDNMEPSKFTLTRNIQSTSHHQNRALKDSRKQFLQKAISVAVETVQLVEFIHQPSSDDDVEILPSTKLNVDEYKKWLQLCYDLAGVWNISFDELRRHQICELYSNGFDRLAEEVIPSINENEILASQLLVIIGKRVKYLIQNSEDLSNQMTNLSPNLSEWLKCLDISKFKNQNEAVDDIEMIARYVAKWLPQGHPDQNLAVEIIESLCFIGATHS